jgi:hypothetical protein
MQPMTHSTSSGGMKHGTGRVAITALAVFAISGTVFGVIASSGHTAAPTVPMASLNNQVAPTKNPVDAANLAAASSRWTNEHPNTGPGGALNVPASDLLTNVGAAHDTVTAFATNRGSVCFEIRAAGTCGNLNDSPAGISVAILATRAGGTRVYGVTSDQVQRVQVDVAGTNGDAQLENNAFYFQLPPGTADSEVQQVVSTWKDGSTHVFHVHG